MSSQSSKSQGSAGNNKTVIIIVILLFMGVCAFAVYTLMEMEHLKSQVKENSDKALPTQVQATAEPIYVPMDTFTVSLKPDNGGDDHVLYIGLTLSMKNAKEKALLVKFMPEYRSRILLLLSQQTAAELSTHEGKAAFIQAIKNKLNEPVSGSGGTTLGVVDVLFNVFILR